MPSMEIIKKALEVVGRGGDFPAVKEKIEQNKVATANDIYRILLLLLGDEEARKIAKAYTGQEPDIPTIPKHDSQDFM